MAQVDDRRNHCRRRAHAPPGPASGSAPGRRPRLPSRRATPRHSRSRCPLRARARRLHVERHQQVGDGSAARSSSGRRAAVRTSCRARSAKQAGAKQSRGTRSIAQQRRDRARPARGAGRKATVRSPSLAGASSLMPLPAPGSGEQPRVARQRRLMRQVEFQRRDQRCAVCASAFRVGAVSRFLAQAALEGDPVIGIAASVLARSSRLHDLLRALALHG